MPKPLEGDDVAPNWGGAVPGRITAFVIVVVVVVVKEFLAKIQSWVVGGRKRGLEGKQENVCRFDGNGGIMKLELCALLLC